MGMNKKTQVWAHRGASAYAPENTVAAYRLAADMNADGIEIDVHESADGQIVVIHDSELKRVSNGACCGNVETMNYEDIRKVDVSGAFADQYPGAYVPLLSEVYQLCIDTGLFINVELKAYSEAFTKKVAEETRRFGMQGHVIFSCFDADALKYMKAAMPEEPTAFLYSNNLKNPAEFVKSIGASALHPEQSIALHGGYIDNAHKEGILVNPWTVNDRTVMRQLVEKNVDALITNCPDIARRVVDDFEV